MGTIATKCSMVMKVTQLKPWHLYIWLTWIMLTSHIRYWHDKRWTNAWLRWDGHVWRTVTAWQTVVTVGLYRPPHRHHKRNKDEVTPTHPFPSVAGFSTNSWKYWRTMRSLSSNPGRSNSTISSIRSLMAQSNCSGWLLANASINLIKIPNFNTHSQSSHSDSHHPSPSRPQTGVHTFCPTGRKDKTIKDN